METTMGLRRFIQAFSVAALVCWGIPAFAQFNSTVQGTVTDPSGALVQGASVALTNTATNVTRNTTTNGDGIYVFNSLGPGNFVVTVNKTGFDQSKISTIVTEQEIDGVNVMLHIAQAGKTVTVTGSTKLLNPEETRLQLTLSASELELIPAQNHSVIGALMLTPGVTGFVEDALPIPIGQNSPGLTANGQSAGANLYTVDSVPINSVTNTSVPGGGGSMLITPPMDALAETSLQTTTFNVEYGTTSSMQIAMVTKAGANKFHGSGDLTYDDKIMDAFAFGVSSIPPVHNLYQTYTLGGPIWKDRTFFFGSYEGEGLYNSGNGVSAWYTPQFSSYIATADPNSISVANLITANPAPALVFNGTGIVTGADNFGGGGQPIQEGNGCGTPSVFNVPCTMPIIENGVVNSPFIMHGREWSIRIDQYFNGGKDRIFGSYFNNYQTSGEISAVTNWNASTPSGGDDATFNFTHTFTPHLLNTATFSRATYRDAVGEPVGAHNTELLLPFNPQVNDNSGTGTHPFFGPDSGTEGQFYGRDSVYWTHGRHSFEFGVVGASNYSTDANLIYAKPFEYRWNTLQDLMTDTLDLEIIYGHYSGTTGAYELNTANGITTRYAGFVQDSWKITPRLTINYGIRYDNLGNPSPYTGSIPWANSIFSDNNINNIATNISSKQVNQIFNSDKQDNFLPRVGFAWSPLANDPSTVLRGGAGLYQDTIQLSNLATDVTTNPPSSLLSLGHQTPTTTPPALLSFGTQTHTPPYGFVFPSFPGSGIPSYRPDGSVVGAPTGLTGVDPNLQIPKTVLWNLAVEHELPGRALVSLTYSGSHSYNILQATDLDRPAGQNHCDPPNTGPGCTPTEHLANPEWSDITPQLNGAVANYNAMIAEFKQQWHNLNWDASYTWGHSLSSPGTGSAVEFQYDPKAQYSSGPGDVTNRLSLYALYEIPVSANLNWAVREIIGGWNLDAMVIAESGTPFTIYYNNPQGDFSGTDLANIFGIPDYAGSQRRSWSKQQLENGIFGSSAYSQVNGINPLFPAPACGVCIGNAGNNQFRYQDYITWNQSVMKSFTLPWFQGEKSMLQIRGQGFNMLNRVNFSGVQSVNPQSGSFGLPAGAFQARVIQIGSRFQF